MDKEKYINSTKFIYDTLEPVLDKRAEYLKSLYYSTAPRILIGGTYIDIGAGTTNNGKVFGKSFKEVILLDLNPIDIKDEDSKLLRFTQGDAQSLPFESSSADLLTLISIIEHVENPQKAISEAERVVKPKGDIIIQVPNIHFPIDLHTGILNPFWIPSKLRKAYTTLFGFPNYTKEVYSLPVEEEIINLFSTHTYLLGTHKIIYPISFIPLILRPFYWILLKTRILNLIPLGHLYVFRKQ
jgi:ubiquinone/menaquinone biosynthesis C-methylase UbiE